MKNHRLSVASQPFRFLDLPAELRNRIYDYVFEDALEKRLGIFDTHRTCPNPAVTAVCRQLRTETLALHQEAIARFWKNHIFESVLNPKDVEDPDLDARVATGCQRIPGTTSIRKLTVWIIFGKPGLLQCLAINIDFFAELQRARCKIQMAPRSDTTSEQRHRMTSVERWLPGLLMRNIGQPLSISNNVFVVQQFGRTQVQFLLEAMYALIRGDQAYEAGGRDVVDGEVGNG